jgi:hypothetical protein
MSITRIFTKLTLVTLLVSGAAMSGTDLRNFWFLNNTGAEISRIYISPHESYRWGRNVLGDASLPDGIGTAISFDSTIRTSCDFDFKLVFSGGSEQVYEQGRNLCLLHAVQFNSADSIGY